jgi:hypothetical protein
VVRRRVVCRYKGDKVVSRMVTVWEAVGFTIIRDSTVAARLEFSILWGYKLFIDSGMYKIAVSLD